MRLLIDTTGINVNARPLTGIPRVVHNYLTLGYEFGARQGIEVLPVCIVGQALVLQRPSAQFPHPPGLPPTARRATLRARLLMASFLVVLGLAHVPYGLAWLVLFARPPAGTGSRVHRAGRPLSGLLHRLKAPARALWARYMQVARVDPVPGDIFLAPAYWHDVDSGVLRALTETMQASFVLVHDILPVTLPQYYHSPWREMFRENVGAALTGFSAVLVISEHTGDCLRQHFPAEAAQAVISVARNGLEPLPADGPVREGLSRLFAAGAAPFLMVGTIEPKKGHLEVLQVLRALHEAGQSRRRLLVLGRRGWMYDEIVAALRQAGQMVVWLEDASDAELAFAYRHAHLMIQASRDEGFGLPMVEAASAGCVVVARRSRIAAEVLGGSGLFFDGAEDLRALLLAMEDPEAHAARRALLRGFDWPRWQAVVPAVFQALLDHGRGLPLPPTIQPEGQGTTRTARGEDRETCAADQRPEQAR